MRTYENTNILIFSTIALLNLVLIGSFWGIVLSAFQYLFVVHQILKKNFQDAVLWHFVFIITSVSATGATGITEETNAVVYNYVTLKLAGPVGFSYLISVWLFFLTYKKRSQTRQILFFELIVTLGKLAVCGVVIGLCGLFIDGNYSFEEFVNASVYMGITIINAMILYNCHSEKFLSAVHSFAPLLLYSVIIASFVAFVFLNVSSSYGGVDSIVQTNDAVYFAAILFAGIYQARKKSINMLCILLVLFIYSISVAGKGIIAFAASLLVVAYFTYFDKGTRNYHPRMRKIMMVLCILIALSASAFTLSESSLTIHKLGAVTSLFSGNLSTMEASPYIRVASTLNILYEGLYNPFFLIFGHGFGGYFRDNLQLFNIVDLTNGGYSQAIVNHGCFPYAHDTYANVPLKNGLLGLWLLGSIIVKYIKRIKFNYLAFASFIWLGLIFYFNTLISTTGLFLLYASEYGINYLTRHKK